MATRLTGALGPFMLLTMQWFSYAERMEEFLLANGDDGRQKVAVLLSMVGEATYKLLRDLCSKFFADVVTLLTNHLQPKPTVIAKRYKFHQSNQLSGETVAAYIAELRKLAKTCDYGAFLEESLRDKLVCGLISEEIKRQRLKEKTLTLTQACETAMSIDSEVAAKDSSLMGSNSTTGGVNHVQGTKKKGNPKPHPKPTNLLQMWKTRT